MCHSHSSLPLSDFCLTYLFTDASLGFSSADTIIVGRGILASACSSHGVGVVTTKASGGRDLLLNYTRNTFVHELGHNFGSNHDEDDSDKRCTNRCDGKHTYVVYVNC